MDGNNTNLGTVNGTMTLTDNATGKSVELPVIEGSIGPKVIDVRKLYAQTGYFTYDPGFMATAACRSSITYIDGDEGVLLYRGYPIEELAAKSDFLEVAYLLLNGELPNREAKGAVRPRHHAPHDGARADRDVLPRVPPRRAPDGGAVRRRRRAVGVLSRLDRHQRPVPADDRVAPADRQVADDRRDGLQILARPAVHVSEELAGLRRELPPHDLRGAVRGVQGQPGPGARRWTASSSCTPTTSRTPRPRPCATPGRPAPTRSPASPPASPRCGARRMAAPTRRC